MDFFIRTNRTHVVHIHSTEWNEPGKWIDFEDLEDFQGLGLFRCLFYVFATQPPCLVFSSNSINFPLQFGQRSFLPPPTPHHLLKDFMSFCITRNNYMDDKTGGRHEFRCTCPGCQGLCVCVGVWGVSEGCSWLEVQNMRFKANVSTEKRNIGTWVEGRRGGVLKFSK